MKKKIIFYCLMVLLIGCSSVEENQGLDSDLLLGTILSTAAGNANDFQNFDFPYFYSEKTKAKQVKKIDSNSNMSIEKTENGIITNTRTKTKEKTKTKSTSVGFGLF